MKEDLSLESLRRRPHWSFSSINGLINFCSLKWAFQYVYREEPSFTPVALVFGSVYHKALTFAFGRMARGEEVTSIECTELFADLLSRKLADCEPEIRLGETDTIDSLIGCGQRMIAAYLDSVDTVETIHAVSVPFSVPLRATDGTIAGKPLIGEFDLTVSAKDGTYTVVRPAGHLLPLRPLDERSRGSPVPLRCGHQGKAARLREVRNQERSPLL